MARVAFAGDESAIAGSRPEAGVKPVRYERRPVRRSQSRASASALGEGAGDLVYVPSRRHKRFIWHSNHQRTEFQVGHQMIEPAERLGLIPALAVRVPKPDECHGLKASAAVQRRTRGFV